MAKRAEMTRSPKDRLTRICDQMTKTFDMHPEHRKEDRCMVFLDDGKMGGIVLHGYENEQEAAVDLFLHLRAMFQAQGMNLEFIGIPNDVGDLDG
jgi:hypothetical protein